MLTPNKNSSWLMSLAALGVVFGDIGTSPLYTFHVIFQNPICHGRNFPLGVASLIIWSLIAIVTFKYVFLVMKADYRGEGGIFALLAFLNTRNKLMEKFRLPILTLLLLLGASFLYGDGAITPAISVLSAIEGLEGVYPSLTHLILPLTAFILASLFSVQHLGTGNLGKIFGSIMLVWFLVLGFLGARQIIHTPSVLEALNPWYAWNIIRQAGKTSVFLFSSAVLAITGVEALYADMGHFGRPAISRAWNFIVFPCLVLNYLGQAALASVNPGIWEKNIFFQLAPNRSLLLVVLATIATVIASQALISGVFSLTAQARDLGLLPRFLIIHTNRLQRGQVYLPTINWVLAAVSLLLVFTFQSSTKLAAAYGLAVMGTMLITSIAFSVVVVRIWKYPFWCGALILSLLLSIELPFFLSSLTKFFHGAWFPLFIASILVTIMITWHQGRALIKKKMLQHPSSIEDLIEMMRKNTIHTIPGTSVVVGFNLDPRYTIARILEWSRLNQSLYEKIILLTPVGATENHVPLAKSLKVSQLGPSVWHVLFYYGYMQEVNLPEVLRTAAPELDLELVPEKTFFLLPRETIIQYTNRQMMRWQQSLFAWLSRNMSYAPDYFFIPYSQIIDFTWIMKV